MKKIWLLVVFCIIFFAGCANKVWLQHSYYNKNILDKPTLFESLLHGDIENYPDPQIIITSRTGTVLSESTPMTGEYAFEYNWTFRFSHVSGYGYTYIYKDLGIQIDIMRWYAAYFYAIPTDTIFARHDTLIYHRQSEDTFAEYIQVLYKDPTISFYEQIQNNHLPSWCKMEIFTWIDLTFLETKEFIAASFSDTSLVKNTCIQDKDFPTNEANIIFLMDPKHTEKYYKISFGCCCAPGPCTIFGNIEFF